MSFLKNFKAFFNLSTETPSQKVEKWGEKIEKAQGKKTSSSDLLLSFAWLDEPR